MTVREPGVADGNNRDIGDGRVLARHLEGIRDDPRAEGGEGSAGEPVGILAGERDRQGLSDQRDAWISYEMYGVGGALLRTLM